MAVFLKNRLFTALILVLLFLSGIYFFSILRKNHLDDDARKSAPGNFIKLTNGIVHYELMGPKTGKTVVLIHGLTTPYFIFDNNIKELVREGFRVLRYDHYGRGFSDRPDVKYDRELYDRQLLQLLKGLEIRTPVILTGLSMGGAVAINFTRHHPEMVSKVSLISPAGFSFKVPFTVKLATTPLIGEYLMAVLGDGILLRGTKRAFAGPEKLTGFTEKFQVQMKYSGYKRAVLSTMRHMQMNNMKAAYEEVGRLGIPVQLIWGRKDRVLPFTLSEKVRQAIPQLRFYPLDNAGHTSNYENPEIVNPILIRFMKGD